MTEPPSRTIHLVETERIVPHGAARSTWLIRLRDGWTRASEWPGASVEKRDAGPGTVWERVVTLAAPAGTELVRVETRPRARSSRDPLSYLENPTKGPALTTRRTGYRIDVGGRVRPVDKP